MAPPEDIDFELIRQVQLNESRSKNLTKVPADFFSALAEHIDALKARAREEVAADPMSARANLVQNELRSTIRLAQEIVSFRLRKIANRSVDALEGGKVDLRNLTPTEKELYDQLASFMARSKEGLLPAERRGDKGPVQEAPPVSVIEEPPPADVPPEATTAVSEEGADALVHVLEDMPTFVGEGGRSYNLQKGDMVNLPRRMAQILIDKGVVEEVSSQPPAGGKP